MVGQPKSSISPPNTDPDRRARRLTLAITLGTGGAAWLAATGWVLHRQGRLRVAAPTPCPALVLGCRPGPALDARVGGAVALYRSGRATCLVISGRGESEAGAETARRMGVPDEAIQLESSARSTWENLSRTAHLYPTGQLWIASDRFHLPRALWFASRLGLEGYPCPIDRPLRQPRVALAREGMSVLYGVVRQGRGEITE